MAELSVTPGWIADPAPATATHLHRDIPRQRTAEDGDRVTAAHP
jgi:hypothetical protein